MSQTEKPALQALSNAELLWAFKHADSESEHAEVLMAEIKRRDLDI